MRALLSVYDKSGIVELARDLRGMGWDLISSGGTAAAISAARMGCKVALVQDRGVLGGNGSSEVRVWAMGGTRRGLYPNLGEIVEEFQDTAKLSPGTYEEFGDDKKEDGEAEHQENRCNDTARDNRRNKPRNIVSPQRRIMKWQPQKSSNCENSR